MRRPRHSVPDSPENGVFTREEAEALIKRIFGMIPNTKASVLIMSHVSASTRFTRGDTHLASETSSATVDFALLEKDRRAFVRSVTRYDDEGLRAMITEAWARAEGWRGVPSEVKLLGPQVYKTPPKIYFEENLRLMTPDGRAAVVNAALDATEAAGLVGAGSVALNRNSFAVADTDGLFGYSAQTLTQFSLTARTRDGTGSGWGWSGYEDWSRVDAATAIARAVDLAQRSAKPVALEPGRYTVILEPPAVAELLAAIRSWDARAADAGRTVFSNAPRGTNKLGLRMIDARLAMVSDPWDPEASSGTVALTGHPIDKVQWFSEGMLRELLYDEEYAHQKNRAPTNTPPGTLRLDFTGEPVSLEEMIATTKRGVWVNRLWGIQPLNNKALLLTGTTRDGTFLIENGKITKAVKNFRFMELPFVVLNKLEAAGTPVRASGNIVAPRLKVRDFEFTSLTDAV